MKQSNIRQRFIVAAADSLVIETIQTNSKTNQQSLRVVKLKGIWRANDYNQLCFEVSCRKGPPETYTFKGSWKLNRNQQIEYISEDGRDILIFKGYWDISVANRLVYVFEGSSISRFEFKVQLESPVLYPKKGEIRYRIATGMRQSRTLQLLILYGEWLFGRNLSLSFQMDYGQGKVRAIEFGAQVTFGRNNIIFALRNEFGDSLGISLTLTHRFLESFDAKAFVRLKSRFHEQVIEVGVNIPF